MSASFDTIGHEAVEVVDRSLLWGKDSMHEQLIATISRQMPASQDLARGVGAATCPPSYWCPCAPGMREQPLGMLVTEVSSCEPYQVQTGTVPSGIGPTGTAQAAANIDEQRRPVLQQPSGPDWPTVRAAEALQHP